MQDLTGWTAPRWPDATELQGRYARLERLSAADHGAEIHAANRVDDSIWNYLPYGPFASQDAYCAWAESMAAADDPRFYAIRDLASGRCCGVASYLRIAPETGVIEVGHINFAAPLQRTRAATEAIYLMMKWVFEAGYRRFEWKCDARNQGSRRAAQRFGFSYEGIFRQATIVKGRNRDTAWFAMIDKEWPELDAAFRAWLAPGNFDADGQQRQSLGVLTAPILVARDPGVAMA